jgi:excisionase family DNA binding protein
MAPRQPLRVSRKVRVAERWLLWNAAFERLLVDVERASRDVREIQQRWSRLRRELHYLRRSQQPPHVRHMGVSVREAAAALDVSEDHLRRLLRQGLLIGVRYGGRIGWRLSRRYVNHLAEHRAATGRWPHAEEERSLCPARTGVRRGGGAEPHLCGMMAGVEDGLKGPQR